MDRNVLLAVAAAQQAWDDAGLDGDVDRSRVGILVGSAIGGIATIAEQQQVLAERGARPRLAVLHPVRARRHRERPDRDPARDHGAELRAGLRLRDRLDGDRRGGRGDPARAGGRRPRRRHRGADHPAHPRRLLRDAGPRRRGGGSDARVAAVRRDPRRVRDGGGGVHPRPRGPRGRAGARGDASTRRSWATAPRTTPITSPSPSRRRPGSRT